MNKSIRLAVIAMMVVSATSCEKEDEKNIFCGTTYEQVQDVVNPPMTSFLKFETNTDFIYIKETKTSKKTERVKYDGTYTWASDTLKCQYVSGSSNHILEATFGEKDGEKVLVGKHYAETNPNFAMTVYYRKVE